MDGVCAVEEEEEEEEEGGRLVAGCFFITQGGIKGGRAGSQRHDLVEEVNGVVLVVVVMEDSLCLCGWADI